MSSTYSNYADFVEKRLTIVNKEGKNVPFKLNPIQEAYVRLSSNRDIILKARQQGFSSFILAAFTADFLLKENSNSVVVADKSDNAIALLGRVKHYLKAYEEYTGTKIPLKYNSKYQLVNGANNATYTIGTAQEQDFGRSRTITNLHLSEAAFYPNLPSLLAGAAQAVVPNGKLVIETTANGFNAFKTLWDDSVLGHTAYQPLFFKASDFYDQPTLELKHKELGERLFKQEYPETPIEAFITSGATFFDQSSLAWYLNLVKPYQTITKEQNFRRYRQWQRGEFVVVFADTAVGGGDYCAAQFMSKTKLDVPLVYHSKSIATEMTPQLHLELERIEHETGIQPVIAYERNNGGAFEMERLASLNRSGKYKLYTTKKNEGTNLTTIQDTKLGWDTNTATRPKMLGDLKDAVDKRLLNLYDEPTINEMFSFIVARTSSSWKAQAESGAHDDLIMSLAGVYQLYQTEKQPIDLSRVHMPNENLFDSDGFYT
ncbi:MAG: hypothetical protein NVS1B10_08210 [Candidatus Saccharimonadales bacterium]